MQGDVLKSLRDIDGVQGSFVGSPDGRLLARDLPAVFSDFVLAEAATRIGRLCEALSAAERDVSWVRLGFADYHLFLKPVDSSFLAILAQHTTNLPALKMAASLVARRLPRELQAAPEAVPLAPASEPPATQASPRINPPRVPVVAPEARGFPAGGAGGSKARIFRGRRVEG